MRPKSYTMARSSYSHDLTGEKLRIIDLNQGGMSVTNDMENVLKEIHLLHKVDLTDKKIIYLDSEKEVSSVSARNTGSFERPDYEVTF